MIDCHLMKIPQYFKVDFKFDIHFTDRLFDLQNNLLADCLQLGQEARVAIVIDKGVIDCHHQLINDIKTYFERFKYLKLITGPKIVVGGEEAKNQHYHEEMLRLINEHKIDRHSYLMAIGGGAVLDMVGFAASVGHRGIRHIRIPTTVLSQNDSGVGVKNGINYFGKKNFIGAFSPPDLVINDFQFLRSLDQRDWVAGTAEAVKVAVIKDHDFFCWLEKYAFQIRAREMEPMKQLIFECAKWHSKHIGNGNDPFERGSARPLDFGHWSAHKLEQLTNFKIRHGEAVAIGIAIDVLYTKIIGILDHDSASRIVITLQKFGFRLFHPVLIDKEADKVNGLLFEGLEEFREHLGGRLTITLLDRIGHGVEVHEMQFGLIKKAIFELRDLDKNAD